MEMKNILPKRISFKAFLFPSILLLALAACKVFSVAEPPGVGEQAERGYAVCDPIIAALEQYKADKGEYPEALEGLMPGYLPHVPTKVNDEEITYIKTGESFSLAFHYIGPGVNTCTFTPEDTWHCSGYY